MANFKTPGVYIQEISTLPASVAPVATAIPGFVGYTDQQAVVDGVTLDNNTPVRIESLMEFEQIFGGPFSELFTVTIEDPATGETNPQVTVTTPSGLSPYNLYYHLKMFFENGGGPCYVISVGNYSSPGPTTADISESELSDGLDACEEIDEITLLVVPEAIHLDANGRQNINDSMLVQCNKLQDRFAIMDALTDPAETVVDDGDNFRDDVGSDYLKYGAAYYPSLKTTIQYEYGDGDVTIVDNRGGAGSGFFNGSNLGNLIDASAISTAAQATIVVEVNADAPDDVVVLDGVSFTIISTGNRTDKANDLNAQITAALGTLDNIITTGVAGRTVTLTSVTLGAFGNSISLVYNPEGTEGLIVTGFAGGNDSTDRLLYSLVKNKLKEFKLVLYPSAAMAGIFARVDRNRGVWKAPANVSMRLVDEPSILVTDEQQGSLNVDADSGKSINVIRKFAKKGIIVWGARTLAGNDNEWRYVPVRRLYIFMEESIEKATEPTVFEPNDAQTWTKLKVMIENFLSKLWREGALAGAKPEDAFFVNVGLGKTMTALDILEGRLIIEVGVAAVRPAEFIIMKFMHKLQES